PSWTQDLGDQLGRARFLLELVEGALPRRLVGAPAQELRAVTEAAAADVIVAHLRDQLWCEGFPLTGPFRAPARWSARRIAAEARRLSQFFQPLGQLRAIGIRETRREPDVVELAILIVEAKQQRADLPAFFRVAEPADHAIGG